MKSGDKVIHSISFSSYGKRSKDRLTRQQHFEGVIEEIIDTGLTARVKFLNHKTGNKCLKICQMKSLKLKESA